MICPHCKNDDPTLIEDTLNGFWLCNVCSKLWSKFPHASRKAWTRALRGMKL